MSGAFALGGGALGGSPGPTDDIDFAAAGGNLFWVVYPGAGAQPSAIQIRTGLQADGSPATDSGFEVSPTVTTSPYTLSTGPDALLPSTQYRAAFVWSDGTLNSNVVVTDIFTTAAVGSGGNKGAGKPSRSRSRKRYQVEIDEQVFDVSSPEEAQALLDQAKEQAEEVAKAAIERAAKTRKTSPRKVLSEARKALQVPEIEAEDAEVRDAAQEVMRQIEDLYASAMRDIEIAALLRRKELEEDDEDVLLLL
jgi:hypothetical protein